MSFERDPIPVNPFQFEGPIFKHDMQYLTQEGYPLGTVCWYYIVSYDGSRKFCCADTADDALKIAVAFLEKEAIASKGRRDANAVRDLMPLLRECVSDNDVDKEVGRVAKEIGQAWPYYPNCHQVVPQTPACASVAG